MKKIIALSVAVFLFAQCAWSQSHPATLKYDGKEQSGIASDINLTSSVVTDAIKDKMARMGFKGTSTKGWVVYKSANIPALGADAIDLYTKVETKSRKDKGNSEIQVLILKDGNFEPQESDYYSKSYDFIESIKPIAEALSLEIEIKDQEDVLKKNQRKLDDLVSESLSLEKKKRRIEDDIVDNSKKQIQQKDEVSKQKSILNQLLSKRKN